MCPNAAPLRLLTALWGGLLILQVGYMTKI